MNIKETIRAEIDQLKNKNMIWRTDKPTEKVIVAKLTEDFCHLKDNYAILRLVNEPYRHYSEDGEEIPYAAIEKWASLEDELAKLGWLEGAADKHIRRVADAAGHPGWDWTTQDIADAFIAGAEWQAEKDKEIIEVAEDHALLAGMMKMKEQMIKEAMEGIVQDDGQFINFGDGKYIDLDPTMENKPVFELTDGDKVKVIVIKED